MKTRLFSLCVLASILLGTTSTFARRVYVRLASDATAWSHVAEDFDNVVITLPEGSSDFAKDVLVQLRPGDEVWVAKGTYNNSAKVTLYNDENAGLQYGNIRLYGGFAGTETAPEQRAVTDKDENGLTEPWEFVNETNFRGKGNSRENASDFQLVQIGNESVLDGVTLSDNYYTGAERAAGGTINSLMRNCIVRDVTTEFAKTIYGGGLYVTGGQVESCLIESCKAIIGDPASTLTVQGGGIHIYGTNDNTLDLEPTGYIKNSVIRNCTAGEGSNMGRGGAIFGKNGALIENCVVCNNQASHTGGAFYFHKKGDEGRQVNRIINCTMVNNATPAVEGTPSTCISEGGYVEIYNTVMWSNSHKVYPSVAEDYQNTIRLFANSTSNAYPYLDGIAFNGFIQNPEHNKNANFNPIMLVSLDGIGTPIEGDEGADPLFTQPVSFIGAAISATDLADIRKANYTLKEGSPLIDAGLNEPSNKIEGYDQAVTVASFSGKDALGAERNVGEKFDIGAYEYGVEYVIGPNSAPSVMQSNHKILARENRIEITGLESPATIRLYTANGTLVSTTFTEGSKATLDVDQQGFYIVSLTTGNRTYSEKVIL